MTIDQIALKVAAFESRITVLESKHVLIQAQLATNTKADATLANAVYAQEGEILQARARR